MTRSSDDKTRQSLTFLLTESLTAAAWQTDDDRQYLYEKIPGLPDILSDIRADMFRAIAWRSGENGTDEFRNILESLRSNLRRAFDAFQGFSVQPDTGGWLEHHTKVRDLMIEIIGFPKDHASGAKVQAHNDMLDALMRMSDTPEHCTAIRDAIVAAELSTWRQCDDLIRNSRDPIIVRTTGRPPISEQLAAQIMAIAAPYNLDPRDQEIVYNMIQLMDNMHIPLVAEKSLRPVRYEQQGDGETDRMNGLCELYSRIRTGSEIRDEHVAVLFNIMQNAQGIIDGTVEKFAEGHAEAISGHERAACDWAVSYRDRCQTILKLLGRLPPGADISDADWRILRNPDGPTEGMGSGPGGH